MAISMASSITGCPEAMHVAERAWNCLSLCSGGRGHMNFCEQCGSGLSLDNRGRVKRFCNRSCASLFREGVARLARQCKCHNCGNAYDRPLGASRRGKFCSRLCFAASIRRPEKSPDVIANKKMASAACSLLTRALRHKGVRKSAKLFNELGYTTVDLRRHLEAHFEYGMSWENYGRNGWHVDHIKPIVTFPKTASIREINSLSNLRPLWEHENCGRRICG